MSFEFSSENTIQFSPEDQEKLNSGTLSPEEYDEIMRKYIGDAEYERMLIEDITESVQNKVPLQPTKVKLEDISPEEQKEVLETLSHAADVLNNMKQSQQEAAQTEEKEVKPEKVVTHTPPSKAELLDLLNTLSDEELPDGLRICPNCSHDRKRPIGSVPTQEDKRFYLFSMCQCKPFEKTYKLFDNMLTVTFREMRQYEADSCYDALKSVIREFNNSNYAVKPLIPIETLNRFMMSICLKKLYTVVDGNENVIYFNDKELGDIKKGVKDLSSEIVKKIGSESVFSAISIKFTDFMSVLSKCSLHATESDFWETT